MNLDDEGSQDTILSVRRAFALLTTTGGGGLRDEKWMLLTNLVKPSSSLTPVNKAGKLRNSEEIARYA